jgi:hypothetical protein
MPTEEFAQYVAGLQRRSLAPIRDPDNELPAFDPPRDGWIGPDGVVAMHVSGHGYILLRSHEDGSLNLASFTHAQVS